MKKYIIYTLFLCITCNLYAQYLNLLSGKYSQNELEKILVPHAEWTPFPHLSDLSGWAKADKASLDRILQNAEKYLTYEWPTVPATYSLMYVRTGNRSNYERVSFEKRNVLGGLILAEIAENKGRFIDQIINGVWSICEESWWGVPAHLPKGKEYSGLMDVEKPFVDLFAAETGTFLAWADYFIGDKFDAVSPQIRKRIYNEVNTRLMTPLMNQYHGWMGKTSSGQGPNNWNPWICSNWINFVLLLEKDDTRRAEMTAKILKVLDEFVNPYPADGGCDEGPGYWGAAAASLFDNIAFINLATNNAFNYVYENEKVRNMGKFIYRAQISEKYFLNFADASPKPGVSSTMVYRYGKAISDPDMMDFGAYYRSPVAASTGMHYFRNLFAVFIQDEIRNAKQRLPLPMNVWLPDIEVMIARDKEGTTDGFYLGAKGGHNSESHNHNDIGNYVVFYDGLPLLIDVGSGTYTAKTFSNRRYDIWYNCSDYHNTPTINSVTQSPGRDFKAKEISYKKKNASAELSLDIANAYPKEAAINSWKRTITLNRNKNVLIKDITNLQKANSIVQHLMTCYPVEVSRPGEILIHYQSEEGKALDFAVTYNPKQWDAQVEKVALTTEEDKGVKERWGDTIYRINLNAISPKLKDTYAFEIKKK